MSMRDRHNSLAEDLWYLIQRAVDSGVSIEDFRREARDCWIEVHRERAEQAWKEFDRKLDKQ